MKESARKIQISVRWIASDLEREKLMLSRKDMFPENCPCAMCGHRWMQHKGEVCPVRVGEMRQTLDGSGNYAGGQIHLILPEYRGSMTAFVPDEAYYKTPDFAVV